MALRYEEWVNGLARGLSPKALNRSLHVQAFFVCNQFHLYHPLPDRVSYWIIDSIV